MNSPISRARQVYRIKAQPCSIACSGNSYIGIAVNSLTIGTEEDRTYDCSCSVQDKNLGSLDSGDVGDASDYGYTVGGSNTVTILYDDCT